MNFRCSICKRPSFVHAVALCALVLTGGYHQADFVLGPRFDVDIYGNIYVLDPAQSTLTVLSRGGDTLRTIGGAGWGNQEFDRPAGVWARNGIDIFVADYGNHRIQRFDRSLNYVSSLSTRDADDPDARFGYPADVAFSRLGDLFIADLENSRIVKINRSNAVERTFGGIDAGKGRLTVPTRIEIGPKDYVFVLDGERVVTFDAFGNYVGLLYPNLLTAPSCLFADQSCVAVVDDRSVFCFDPESRPLWTIQTDSLKGLRGQQVEDIFVSGESLRLLTPSGFVSATIPGVLDKEKKSE